MSVISKYRKIVGFPGYGSILAGILFLMLFYFMSLPPRLNAQNNDIVFEQISLEEGLSQSIVECILQDRRGFMWFGTEDGLNKYDGYRFTVVRHNPNDPNSLSYNQLLSIIEDRSGIIWIGTFHGGLNRYDPEEEQVTRYQNDPGDPGSLSHDIVRSVCEDESGALWIGTDNGLNRFNKEKKRFTRYMNDPDDPYSLSHNSVRSVYEDKTGVLWIGTDGGGLNRYDRQGDRFIRYQTDAGDPHTLSHNSVRSIYEDKSGVLWIGTVGGGLNKFDRQSEQFKHYRNVPDDHNSLSHNEIFSIFEDHTGVLWIGTNGGGLNRFDREKGEFTVYRKDPNDPNSLSYDEIYSIYEDRSGVLWIGTYGGGINKVDRKKKQFVHYKPDPVNPNSLSHDIVWTIYEDESGLLWIGTHGGGLNRFDRRNKMYTHYRHDPGDPHSLSNDIIRVICEDRSGALWLGTNGGGIVRFDRETEKFESYRYDPDDSLSLSHDEIRSIYEDRLGVLWIGTNGGGLNKFNRHTGEFTRYRNDPDDPTSLSNDFIRVIYEDRTGVFWLGTQGGGLNKFDRETGRFAQYRVDPNDPGSLSNDFIFSIHEDRAGVLWIGTWGGGLNKFDRERGAFTYYSKDDGLSSNSIYGTLEDDEGNLWISTNNGLSRFNPRTEVFKNYNAEDGLQSNEFNGGSYHKSRSGEMFFGGINGFNAFYPENIRDNPHIPPVVITSFQKLNVEADLDRPISETKELQLSYKDYVFSFEFAALDYTVPGKNMYAYKMEGLDEGWIYTDSEKRFASYTTLAPGKYIFRVKGSNNDGVWNEEGTSIEITITPPFWKTWWFRTLSVLFILGLALALYEWRLKNVRMKTELQAAHHAQMSIMPQVDPEIEGFDISGVCIPANEVGGDFYDYIWLNEEKTKFGIAVGDVSGKAMKAAMIAVMSSGMIYSSVDEKRSPREIMTMLNRPMYLKTEDKMFTALCFASIDLNTKEFIYSNAGFNNPLLKSGDSVAYIDGSGHQYPLGIVMDTIYDETVVRLKPDDVLILFSDGIPEARNGAMDFYEYDTLIDLLEKINTSTMSAGEIKERIIEDVQGFTSGAPQNDDMTVIVIKSDFR